MKIVLEWIHGVCEAKAKVEGRPELEAKGRTVGEALGNLVQEHARLFLVDIEVKGDSAGAAA